MDSGGFGGGGFGGSGGFGGGGASTGGFGAPPVQQQQQGRGGGGGNADSKARAVLGDAASAILDIRSQTERLTRVAQTIGTPREIPETAGMVGQLCASIAAGISEVSDSLRDINPRDNDVAYEKRRRLEELQTVTQTFQRLEKSILEKQRQAVAQSKQSEHAGAQERTPLLQQQDTIKASAISQAQYIREREELIVQLERDMTDINEMFKEVSVMIEDQGRFIDQIQAKVVKASDDVSGGVDNLQSANKYQKSTRKKLVCLVVVFVVVAAILSIVLATTLGKKNKH